MIDKKRDKYLTYLDILRYYFLKGVEK